MATATNIYCQNSGVTITPTSPSGSAVPLAQVTSVEQDRKSEQIRFDGDNLKFAALIKNVKKQRTIKITTGASNTIAGLAEDTIYTVVWIEEDARNGVTTGAITWTCINCVITNMPVKSTNNQFGEVTIEFAAFGGTSDADPLTKVVA